MELRFETLKFKDLKDHVGLTLLNMYETTIPKEELEGLGELSVDQGVLSIAGDERRIAKKLNPLLLKSFGNLRNKLNGKRTVYIHKGSGIPLFGHIALGIIDRGSNMIELKPNTGCNIKCTYCSVNEDIRPVDFIVEKDYLVEEVEKLIEFKGKKGIEINLGTQGEPFLYADMIPLVRDLAKNKYITEISINTNGTLLSKQRVDELFDAGLTRLNLSINAIDPEVARKIANGPYNIEQVKNIARYISEKGTLLLAPTWVPGLNDDQMDKIIEFAKTLTPVPRVCIQNFLTYKYGRNPGKQKPWEEFYEDLKALEKKHGVPLIVDKEDFNIFPTKELPKPFHKGEIVEVQVLDAGRLQGERIAVARDRIITIPKGRTSRGKTKVKIVRVKHNIFIGEEL